MSEFWEKSQNFEEKIINSEIKVFFFTLIFFRNIQTKGQKTKKKNRQSEWEVRLWGGGPVDFSKSEVGIWSSNYKRNVTSL